MSILCESPCLPYRPEWSSSARIVDPYLPLPSFIPSTMSQGCWGDICGTARSTWAHFDNPPKSQYPVSNPPFQIDIVGGSPGAAYYLDRGFAIACRINPTSKCLPFIMFYNAASLSTANTIIVEIRANDPATNLPVGQPGDNNILGRAVSPFYPAPPSFAVPINTILDQVDVPVWIVLYSNDYACSNAFVGSTQRRLQLAQSPVGTNNVALFNQANGCQWAIDPTVNSIALTTYKASACSGTVIVDDFAFAKIAQPPIYLNDNCFVRLIDVEGANVGIGVKYTNPDPARAWRRVRFSFAYKKPDMRYFTGTAELLDVTPGQHETFFEMNDLFFPGIYKELNITAEVIQA